MGSNHVPGTFDVPTPEGSTEEAFHVPNTEGSTEGVGGKWKDLENKVESGEDPRNDCEGNYSLSQLMGSLCTATPSPPKAQYQITNSPFEFPYISYRSSGEKLLKYQ